MNFYEHHLGDYMRDTAHLSMVEDAAYRRLLDVYYIKERPLPVDVRECCKLARAQSKAERDAVAYVLREFFELRDDGHHQDRADREIARYLEKKPEAERKKENAAERQRRAREHRKALFERLRGLGIVPRYDATTTELVDLLSQANVTPRHAPVTRDDTATSPQSPVPSPQFSINPVGEGSAGGDGSRRERASPASAAGIPEKPPIAGNRAEPELPDGLDAVAKASNAPAKARTRVTVGVGSCEGKKSVVGPNFGSTADADLNLIGGLTAGAVCRRLRSQHGIDAVNPSSPKLLALLASGAQWGEFDAAASKAGGKANPFAYLLSVVESERRQAAAMAGAVHLGAMPSKPGKANKQESLEAKNRAVAAQWAAEMRAKNEA